MPDRCEHEEARLSVNGYTRRAAAWQLYFLCSMFLGTLASTGEAGLEERRFTPKFSTGGERLAFSAPRQA